MSMSTTLSSPAGAERGEPQPMLHEVLPEQRKEIGRELRVACRRIRRHDAGVSPTGEDSCIV